jgi:hypothetical protein
MTDFSRDPKSPEVLAAMAAHFRGIASGLKAAGFEERAKVVAGWAENYARAAEEASK